MVDTTKGIWIDETGTQMGQQSFEEKHPFLAEIILQLVGAAGEGLRHPDRWAGVVAQDNSDRRFHKNVGKAITCGANVEYKRGDTWFKAERHAKQ